MTASSPYTSDNETFTVDPSDNLSNNTTYKIKVPTGVKDPSGNSMSSDNTTVTGFTTQTGAAPTAPIVSGTTPTNDTTPTWNWSTGGGGDGTYRYERDNSDLTSGATTTTSMSYTPGSAISEGSHTLYVQERNDAGNWSSSGSRTIVINITAPTITGTTVASNNESIAVTFSKAVYNTSGGSGALEASDFTLTISGGTATLSSATPSSISSSSNTYTLGLSLSGTPNGSETITVVPSSSTAIYDAAGNAASTSQSNNTVTLNDKTAPTVSSVAITSATGILNNFLNAGDVVSVTATFSENVSVTGTPQLPLVVGSNNRTSTYASGSGNTPLVFQYTIQAGDNDTNGISIGTDVLALNSGTIRDAAGNNATLTHSAVSANTSYKVDTTAPSVSTFTLSDTALKVGDTATVTLVFSEAVTSFSSAADITVATGTLATMSSSNNVNWTGGIFTPTANTEDPSNTLSLTANSYTDLAGNEGPAENTLNYAVDTLAPTLTFFPVDGATGVPRLVNITITFSEAVRNLDDSALTNDNVTSFTTLKDDDASGTDIDIATTNGTVINSGKTIITIDPDYEDEAGGKLLPWGWVYVAIEAKVEDSAGNTITASNARFKACKSSEAVQPCSQP
jgi:hypothetical protein